MKDIRIIKVKSEMGSGFRGAGLGGDAIQLASLNARSNFFNQWSSVEVKNDTREMFFEDPNHPNAKFIHHIFPIEERVCTEVYNTLKKKQFPIIIAGDHSTAHGSISGIKKKNPTKQIGVVWVDAHADLHSPYTTPSGNMHGMVLNMACHIEVDRYRINDPNDETIALWNKIKNIGIQGPKIAAENIVYIGIRSLEEVEKHIIDTYGIHCITTQDIREKGSESCAQEALQKLSQCDLVYVSFDVDSIDPKFSSGTGTPVPGGLTYEEIQILNRTLIQHEKVCAWEIAEVNPILDVKNKMAEAAFSIIEQIAVVAEKKK